MLMAYGIFRSDETGYQIVYHSSPQYEQNSDKKIKANKTKTLL